VTASAALDATPAILKALRTALIGDATLAPLLAGDKVMVRAPSSAPTPYIELDVREQDFSTATEDGQDFQILLHVWHEPASTSPETALTMTIMGHVRRILHTAALTLDAPFHSVLTRVQSRVGPFHDPDGAVIHGTVIVRAVVDHS
jgi:hypothetical protein